jgi:hypothetical protein
MLKKRAFSVIFLKRSKLKTKELVKQSILIRLIIKAIMSRCLLGCKKQEVKARIP